MKTATTTTRNPGNVPITVSDFIRHQSQHHHQHHVSFATGNMLLSQQQQCQPEQLLRRSYSMPISSAGANIMYNDNMNNTRMNMNTNGFLGSSLSNNNNISSNNCLSNSSYHLPSHQSNANGNNFNNGLTSFSYHNSSYQNNNLNSNNSSNNMSACLFRAVSSDKHNSSGTGIASTTNSREQY
jgi:hypothetical protein